MSINFFSLDGRQSESIAVLRKQKYMSMAALSKKCVQPEKLPQTEDAAKYHAFRVHLQVMQRM